MRTKTFVKKLQLNKKTLVNLNEGNMAQVKGGTGITCGVCNSRESCVEERCQWIKTELTICPWSVPSNCIDCNASWGRLTCEPKC